MKPDNSFLSCVASLLILCLVPGCYRPHKPRSFKAQQERVQRLKPQKPTKQIKHMNAEEAIAAATFYEELGHKDMIVASYHQIINTAPDPDIAGTYLLKLADFYMGEGNIAEAKKQYQRIITIYPGHNSIERAHYRNLIAHYWSMLPAGRDQAATHTTIKLAKQYLSEYPDQHENSHKVRDIIAAAYQRLLAHELLVINFYLNQFLIEGRAASLKSAIHRLQFIQEKIIEYMKPFVSQVESLREYSTLPEDMVNFSTQSYAELLPYAQLLSDKVTRMRQFSEQHTLEGPQSIHPRDTF